MKFKLVPCLAAVAVSALLAFGFYSWTKFEDLKLLVTIFGGISMMLTLGTAFGVSLEHSRKNVSFKLMAWIAAIVLLIANICFFSQEAFSVAAYVVPNGLILIVWMLIAYGISRADASGSREA